MLKHALPAATALLLLAGTAWAQDKPQPSGAWLVEDIAGGGVVDRARTTVEFMGGDGVAGTGGCNRYRGSVTRDGATLRFGALAMTRMACPPAVMEQEARFGRAMDRVRGWRMEGTLLLLIAEDGKPVLRLSPL